MGDDPIASILRLAEAGLPALQWREKDLSALENYRLLSRLTAELVGAAGGQVHILINDRIDIAAALRIGVHLPEKALPTRVARQILPPDAWIGRSTHSLEAARLARDEDADFVTFGPVFETASKRMYGPPQGLAALHAVARELQGFPVLALGGITPERVRACIDAGAAGVAAIGAVWDAPDPIRAYADFARALALPIPDCA